MVPLSTEVTKELRRVIVGYARGRVEPHDVAGRMDLEGQLGILGAGRTGAVEEDLVESTDLFQDAAAIDNVEAGEKVHLTPHDGVAGGDLLVNQRGKQRIGAGVC